MEKQVYRIDPDQLGQVGQSNNQYVDSAFVTPGIAANPLVKDSDLDRGAQPSATDMLRNFVATQPNLNAEKNR